jgi:tight adherence protein B
MLISTIVFLFFLFFTYALFLIATRKVDEKQYLLRQRVKQALGETVNLDDNPIQIIRDDSIGGSPVINRILSPLDFVKKLDDQIRQAGMTLTVSRLLTFCGLAGLMALLASYPIFSLPMVLSLATLAAAMPIVYVNRKRAKRLNKFNAQLPDTLDLLSRSLSVGHAFSESLNQVASEMPDPIATEFRIAFEEQKLGLSTDVALTRLVERVPLLDLKICVTAITIQRETGGNLSEILEKVSQTIRERFKLMEDFRTLTTSSRGSSWILCALPIALVFALTALNPEYMSILWQDRRGHMILVVAGIMQILGMISIRNILRIRV